MREYIKCIKKNKIAAISMSLLAAIFAFCIVMALLPKKEMQLELQGEYSPDTPGLFLLEEGISFTPGTWSFIISYSSDKDFENTFYVQDHNTSDFLLWNNGALTYAGLSETEFTVYMFKWTETAELLLNHGNDSLEINNIIIHETSAFWTRLALIDLLLLMAVAYVMFIVYSFKKEGVKAEDKWALVLVNLAWLLVSIPLLHRGVSTGADLGYHMLRIDGVKETILNGIFPARIEPQWQQGYGYADAIFCCPYFLYIPALFELAGFYMSEAIILYYVLINICTAWISYYCYSEILNSKKAGIVSAAFYVFSIYRTTVIYIVGMLAVGTAMTFLPLILLSLWRLIFEEKEGKIQLRDWMPLAIGYAGIIQSHILSAEISFFLTATTCLIFLASIVKRRAIIAFIKAVGTVLALCIWYLVPFLDYYFTQDIIIRHTQARAIQSEGFYPFQHLIMFPKNEHFQGAQQSMPVGVGFFTILFLFLFFALWYTGRIKNKIKLDLYKFLCYVAVTSFVLLIFTLNSFPWDKIQKLFPAISPLIGNLEFPHRFQAWVFVLIGVTVGELYLFFEKERGIAARFSIIAFTVFSLTFSTVHLSYMEKDKGRLALYNVGVMGNGYVAGNHFGYYGANPDEYKYGLFDTGEGINIISMKKGALNATVKVENYNRQESWVELPLVNYRGYVAESEAGSIPVVYGNNAVVRVLVPAEYFGDISVRYVSPVYWRIAEGISMIYYWILAIYGTIYSKKKRRRQYNNGKSIRLF